MKYFRLNIDCYLVTGKNGTVLYDATGKRIFLLDDVATQVLRELENQKPLKDAWLEGQVRQFLDMLVREGLGQYYAKPVYVDKMLLSRPIEGLEFLVAAPAYQRVSLSITNRCDQNCDFCPNSLEEPLWQACRSCIRRDSTTEDSSLYNNTANLIKQLADLGIAGLHIRGGNPLLEWNRLIEILNIAKNYPALQIAITTPGTGRSLEDILSLCDYPNLNLNIVLLGFDGKNEGISIQQFQLLDALRKRNATFSIAVVISEKNPADRDLVTRFALERWGVAPYFAEFHPLPQDKTKEFRFSIVKNNKKSLYLWRNAREFFHKTQKSACLYGGMEIAIDGSIKPCAGCDNECGKIVDGRLGVALRGDALYDMWKKSKDKIAGCNECALRLACSDCHAAELLGMKNEQVAAGYCPVMHNGNLFSNANRLAHQGFVFLLSVKEGLQACPT